jgi:hypothetical protein
MDREETINEFAELLNIPQFEKIIVHKIEELKVLFKDEIEIYQKTKNKFQNYVVGNMKICDEPGIERGTTYRFELNLTEDGSWFPVKIDPLPSGLIDRFEIVPKEVIVFISAFTPNPEKIEKVKNFTVSRSKERTYEFYFTRYSHHNAMGAICELKKRSVPTPPRIDGQKDRRRPVKKGKEFTSP